MADEMEMKRSMAELIAQGLSLSDVQARINEKFHTRLTYMEVRIMAAELENIDWTSRDPAPPEAKAEPAAADPADPAAPAAGAGRTTVELSKIVRPGAVAGGSVAFASGASAEWFIDQMGQLGLDKVVGEPTEADFQDFQQELRRLFSRGR